MTQLQGIAQKPVSSMNAAQFRRLALDRLGEAVTEPQGDHLLNPEHVEWVMSRAVKPAAVLIPVIARPQGLTVALTRRLDNLRSHSGQVALPGGKIDDTDESVEAAALREAMEEVELNPDAAEVLGRLPDYFSGSGYKIAPVVALVNGTVELRANPAEVDYVFEVPLDFLMDSANHKRGSRIYQGKERYFFEIPYGEHYIWGVTAGIIRLLHERLFP
jgi:8-oxo-dGTP pyrophosphatase MutT (NUDIX family)